jgi:hypothetical protein
MFATELRLFSIRTIVVLTLVWSNQLVKLITSISLNLVKHVNKPIEHVYEPFFFFGLYTCQTNTHTTC